MPTTTAAEELAAIRAELREYRRLLWIASQTRDAAATGRLLRRIERLEAEEDRLA